MTEMDFRTEADEASALVETLLEKVRDGDDTITADEIENARKLADFAKLRSEAAERKAFAAGKAAAAEELERAANQVKAMVLTRSTSHLAALEAKVSKALEAYINAAEEEWVRSRIVASRLRLAAEEAEKYDLPDAKTAHRVFDDGRRIAAYDDEGGIRDYNYMRERDLVHALKRMLEPCRLSLHPFGVKVVSGRPKVSIDYQNGPGSRAAEESGARE
ncbi:hypothetical protein [Pimelobacter simplex]|uniref:hypothetical protein n=1 Tax=Nocardioides simplex TaxID=2045 RepID=UPI001933CF70|nr:hypothetical protein [Pimelobacter simplex]